MRLCRKFLIYCPNIILLLNMRIDFSRLISEQKPIITSSGHLFSTQSNDIFTHNLNRSKKQHSSTPQQIKIASQLSENDRQQRKSADLVTFSMDYPFKISKSVSPTNIESQISFLKVQKILPVSTLKFIQKQISKEISEIKQAAHISDQTDQTSEQKDTQKSLKMERKQIYHPKEKTFKRINKSLEGIIVRSMEKQKEIGIGLKERKRQTLEDRKKGQKRKEQQLSWKKRQQEIDVKNLTLTPLLNYTMNSRVAKQIEVDRKKYFTKRGINDAHRYQSKRSLERIIAEQQMKTERSLVLQSKKKFNLGTFHERLKKSLEKQSQRKMQSQTLENIDSTTGLKMFTPNTLQSKVTYELLFKPACQANAEVNSKKMETFNHSLETFEGKSERDATTTIHAKLPEASPKGEMQKTVKISSTKTNAITKNLQQNLGSRYAQIFYSSESIECFSRTYEHISLLNPMEYHILEPFLSHLEQIQRTQKVNRHSFSAFFKHYYQKLTLYDKQILRESYFMEKKNNQKIHLLHAQKIAKHQKPIKILSKSFEKSNDYYQKDFYFI